MFLTKGKNKNKCLATENTESRYGSGGGRS